MWPSRHWSREVRKKALLAVLCCCALLGILYLRSAVSPKQEQSHWRQRKVESMRSRLEPAAASRSTGPSNDGAFSESAALNSDTSGGDLLKVKLQDSTVRWPWENVEGCSHYGIRFAERGSLPVVALTSYPGSGNTWTRYLLEMASGVFTGSVYYDIGLYGIGYWGEMSAPEDGTTIVQKVHDFGDDQSQRFNRTAIVIVRNPYRAILSFHNYLFGGHKGMAPSSNYLKKGWRSFVMKQVFEWSAHMQQWTDPANRVLVVHYEHLKTDPAGQLRRMLHFLKWPVDEGRLRCVQRDLEGMAHREPPHLPAAVEPFPAELRQVLQHGLRYADSLLAARGHPPLPLDRYSVSNGQQLEDCSPREALSACLNRIDAMNAHQADQSWTHWVLDQITNLAGEPMARDTTLGVGALRQPPLLDGVDGVRPLMDDWRLFQLIRKEL
ncbi:WSC domain-containing protein 1-like [Pollicipes pollicipes]|uniref:WSC domain-containing protein 1-like n=1 Tax=Pollicipes pollicipes TaxID=41117 RepID=UPI001885296A|nr:WSC domain-containing protein 1-like [Pollicipes pollicipes]